MTNFIAIAIALKMRASMGFQSFLLLALICFTIVKSEGPRLSPQCPHEIHGVATISMFSPLPAFALAKCQNGDRPFLSRGNTEYYLFGVLEQHSEDQECQFYAKGSGHLYTLDVEIGWGDENNPSAVIHKRVHTLSCVYDSHGKALTFSETMADRRVHPKDQLLVSRFEQPPFELSIMDISNDEVQTESIYIGKQIRLRAIDKTNSGLPFRALSCVAKNGVNSYAILKSGCGDGHVLKKTIGFKTIGREVYSPYFESFQLKGGDIMQFFCNFTQCIGKCDGDSCLEEIRRKQTLSPEEREREDTACYKADPSVLIQSADDPDDELPIFSGGLH